MIDPLALAFAFDAVEQDGVLRFRQRGGAPVAEMAEDDLVLPEDSAPARLTRAQETELPREVTIGFTDIGTDYQPRGGDLAPAGRRLGAHRACRPCGGDRTTPRRAARRNLAAGSVGRPRERANSRCRRAGLRWRPATSSA